MVDIEYQLTLPIILVCIDWKKLDCVNAIIIKLMIDVRVTVFGHHDLQLQRFHAY